MAFVVTEDCIKCKYQDCVEVCPVDAFFEGKNMLVICDEACIDCGVCESECPAEAILPDVMAPEWVERNKEYSKKWPLISEKKETPADADDFLRVANKFELFFAENDAS